MNRNVARVRTLVLTGALCTALISIGCFGISAADVEEAVAAERSAAAAQAEQVAANHAEALASKDTALGSAVAKSMDLEIDLAELKEANRSLESSLASFKEINATLMESTMAAEAKQTVLELDLQKANDATIAARRETRWLWYQWESDNSLAFEVVGWTSTGENGSLLGLNGYCDDEGGTLYLMSSVATYEDGIEYETKVGLDGGRLRNETLWGHGGNFAMFADLTLDDLWGSKTVLLQWDYEGIWEITFDTNQLLRMFPTPEDLCAGNQPQEYTQLSPTTRVSNSHGASSSSTPAVVVSDGSSIKQWSSPPTMTIDPSASYTAVLETTAGTITVELLTSDAPNTVNNFVFLAREGFYDNVIFHRTIPGFMIQGGDPTGTGGGGPGYRFADETVNRPYSRGVMAMANAGPNTNGSQFFLMHADYPLPPNYTIFGQAVAGLETIDTIATAPTIAGGEGSSPVNPVIIQSVQIVGP